MQQEHLRFVVTDDFDLKFTLIQEAWIGEREVADLRRVDGEWRITFFPEGQFCELSWQTLTEIYQTFSKFVSEQSV